MPRLIALHVRCGIPIACDFPYAGFPSCDSFSIVYGLDGCTRKIARTLACRCLSLRQWHRNGSNGTQTPQMASERAPNGLPRTTPQDVVGRQQHVEAMSCPQHQAHSSGHNGIKQEVRHGKWPLGNAFWETGARKPSRCHLGL